MGLEDELGDLTAKRDQLASGLREIALTAWDYRVVLTSAGFSIEEAFELVRDFHFAILDGSIGDPVDD